MTNDQQRKRQRMQRDLAEFERSGKRPPTNLSWRDYLHLTYAINVRGDVAYGLTYWDKDELPDWDDLSGWPTESL